MWIRANLSSVMNLGFPAFIIRNWCFHSITKLHVSITECDVSASLNKHSKKCYFEVSCLTIWLKYAFIENLNTYKRWNGFCSNLFIQNYDENDLFWSAKDKNLLSTITLITRFAFAQMKKCGLSISISALPCVRIVCFLLHQTKLCFNEALIEEKRAIWV